MNYNQVELSVQRYRCPLLDDKARSVVEACSLPRKSILMRRHETIEDSDSICSIGCKATGNCTIEPRL